MRWLTATLVLGFAATLAEAAPPIVTWATYRECKQKITTFFEQPVAADRPVVPGEVVPRVSPEPILTSLTVIHWKNGGIIVDDKRRLWWLYDGVPFFEHPPELRGWMSTSHTGNQYFMTETGRLFRRMH